MELEDNLKKLKLELKATKYIKGWYVYGTDAMREVEINPDYNLIELELSDFDKSEIDRLDEEIEDLKAQILELEYHLFNEDREDVVDEFEPKEDE